MLIFDGQETGTAFSYHFNQGEHASEFYNAYTNVCENPVCQCNVVHIKFVQENDVELDNKQGISYEISLDVVSKSITQDTKGKINENFAHSLVADLCKEDWDNLYGHYFTRKVLSSEAADLTTVDAVFPVEEVENKSLLIFYSDIIPYSRPIILTVENKRYFVDDMYCVRPDCHCNQVHLLFSPYDNSKQPAVLPEQASITLNLKTRKWKLNEDGESSIDPKVYMDILFEEKDILDLYKTRYETLRLLYKKYRNMNYVQSPVRAADKVGRNDPCPCGSGKKYKKCCL